MMSKFNTIVRLNPAQWPVEAVGWRVCEIWRITKDEVRRVMRRRVKPRFWVFMIAVTMIVFLASFAVMRIRYAQGAQRLERAQSERNALAVEAKELSDQLAFAQTDDYVIRIARDELGMIMPDEVRYVNGAR